MDKLTLEEESFNHQITERIEGGHIPDLRLTEDCDYFYNNTWRRKAYVDLDMGEQFILLKKHIELQFPHNKTISVLEIGCGPGYMSLELAREGYHVTGLDLSKTSIDIANAYARSDPWAKSRGELSYECGDIFTYLPARLFDVVLFVGALHHFKDQDHILLKTKSLLKDTGCIMVHEPTRDRVSKKNAALSTLIEVLTSVGGGYYSSKPIPEDYDALNQMIEGKYLDLKYEDTSGDKVQSPNDNDAGYTDMLSGLSRHFVQRHLEDRYGLFHEIIGGLRYDEATNARLAKFIHDMDSYLCQSGAINATEFFYIGGK